MLNRIVPLLIAFAVGAGPAAFDLCAIACASSSARAAGVGHDARSAKSCHAITTPHTARFASGQHTCDPDGDQPSTPTITTARQRSSTPLASFTAIRQPSTSPRSDSTTVRLTARAPAGTLLRLAAPLRI